MIEILTDQEIMIYLSIVIRIAVIPIEIETIIRNQDMNIDLVILMTDREKEEREVGIQIDIIDMEKADSVIDQDHMNEEEMIAEKLNTDTETPETADEIAETVIDTKILKIAEVDIVAEVTEISEMKKMKRNMNAKIAEAKEAKEEKEEKEQKETKRNMIAEIDEMILRMIGEVATSALNTQIL
jgi:hypothetical protein